MLLVADHDLRDRRPGRSPRAPARAAGTASRRPPAATGSTPCGRRAGRSRRSNEVADVDGVRQLDVEPVDVLVGSSSTYRPFSISKPRTMSSGSTCLPVSLLHLLVADRAHVSLVEEVEAQLLRLGRREHPHGDARRARTRSCRSRSARGTAGAPRRGLFQHRARVGKPVRRRAVSLEASPPSGGFDVRAALAGRESSGRGISAVDVVRGDTVHAGKPVKTLWTSASTGWAC